MKIEIILVQILRIQTRILKMILCGSQGEPEKAIVEANSIMDEIQTVVDAILAEMKKNDK
jgi:hypothetical protein